MNSTGRLARANGFYDKEGEEEEAKRGRMFVFGTKRAAEDASNGTSSSSCLHDVNRVGLTEQT